MEIRVGVFLAFLRTQHSPPFESRVFEIDQKRRSSRVMFRYPII